MKKISNWSILGYIIGIVFALFSSIRYFLLYPDLDRALVYVGIGIIVCGLAWLYNKQLQQSISIEAINDYLADGGKK